MQIRPIWNVRLREDNPGSFDMYIVFSTCVTAPLFAYVTTIVAFKITTINLYFQCIQSQINIQDFVFSLFMQYPCGLDIIFQTQRLRENLAVPDHGRQGGHGNSLWYEAACSPALWRDISASGNCRLAVRQKV